MKIVTNTLVEDKNKNSDHDVSIEDKNTNSDQEVIKKFDISNLEVRVSFQSNLINGMINVLLSYGSFISPINSFNDHKTTIEDLTIDSNPLQLWKRSILPLFFLRMRPKERKSNGKNASTFQQEVN